MQARTELFLHLLGEIFGEFRFAQSRFAPFEPWGYSDDFMRQLQRLQRRALVEAAEREESKDRIYRLTSLGQVQTGGGVDPRARWSRRWDHTWRLVTFDMPESHRSERAACRRELRRLQFGCLQGSVWVSPDPVTEIRSVLEGAAVRTQRLLFIEGRPAAGETDADIVQNAWDFDALNKLYAGHRKLLESLPSQESSATEIRARLPAWTKREFFLWREIMRRDPLLPAVLLPADYPGQAALAAREAALRRARALAARMVSN